MKGYPGFIFRTVRNGRIKFDKQFWGPDEPTNRLNGRRFAFGVYVEGRHSSSPKRLDMLCLWGSVKAYKAIRISDEAYSKAFEEDVKLLAPGGYFGQYWWHPLLGG